MQILPSISIGAAISPALSGPILQLRDRKDVVRNLCIQANYSYSASSTQGIQTDAWVQTSVDGGATWVDIAQFHFTTSSARKLLNLSGVTAISTTAISATDGGMSNNTAQDGILGDKFKVKYSSSGTFVGTTLRIDVFGPQLVPAS